MNEVISKNGTPEVDPLVESDGRKVWVYEPGDGDPYTVTIGDDDDDEWADGPSARPAIALVMIGALAFGVALLLALGSAVVIVLEKLGELIGVRR